jgi:hypothetical protein
MRKRKRTIAAALAIGAAASMSASPAFANTVHGTPENSIGLSQWIQYGGGQWHSSFNNIYQHSAGGISACMNIAPATWPTNGDNINDNSASMVVNGDPSTSNVWSHYNVYVFNWVNCNPDGGYDIFRGEEESSLPDLSNVHYINNGISEYHSITSIELIAAA